MGVIPLAFIFFKFTIMNINQIASAIINDLFSGNLVSLSNRSMISQDQIEDEVIETRNAVIKD